MRYILSAGDIDGAAFDLRVGALSTEEIKNTAMTLAQQFHQEGHSEGHQEGLQKGQLMAQQAAVIEALEIRFDQVPEKVRAGIEASSDSARLHLLLREAIRCPDIESFSRTVAADDRVTE